MKRPLAYITAPWSNNQYENAENAAAYCRQVYDAGYSPICPVLFLPITHLEMLTHLTTGWIWQRELRTWVLTHFVSRIWPVF